MRGGLRRAFLLGAALIAIVHRAVVWAHHHFLDPLLCFGCIYAGTLLVFLSPAAVIAILAPALLSQPLTWLPLASLFDATANAARFSGALSAALLPAMMVFRSHYREWQVSADPLGSRMLYACHAGGSWLRLAWRRQPKRQA